MKNEHINYVILAVPVLIIVGALFYNAQKAKNVQTAEINMQNVQSSNLQNLEETNMQEQNETPEMILKEGVDYKAVIKTSKGDITLDLFESESPLTVSNFVKLSTDGFYNNTIFHRVIKDFMIQGGDPLGNGTGGPGYTFEDEINEHKLVRGSLAMANRGPNTNGSQFFIVTTQETPWLDGKHTNFGTVIEGMDVVDAIEASATGPGDKPLEDITVTAIEILEE